LNRQRALAAPIGRLQGKTGRIRAFGKR